MSGLSAIAGIAGAFGPLIGDSASPYALISTPFRNIGGIFPDVTVEEQHDDEMQITQHPVEVGTPVTDHAFMQPVTVAIHAFWSNSSAQSEGYVQKVYDELQALQKSAQTFNVVTGKRSYINMLIRSLGVRTSAEMEFALEVNALCQQITITSAQSSGSGAPTTTGDPPSDGTNIVGTTNNGQFDTSGSYSMPAVGVVSPDTNGSLNVGNYPSDWGTQQLAPAPSNAPTVGSITQ